MEALPTSIAGLAPGVAAASTVRSIGAVIAVITVAALAIYAVVNLRSGRKEVGSELELAPNRKPYYDDEQLEGRRLTRVLGTGMILLGVVAVGLPLYWLAEPGRMEGAEEGMLSTFIARGRAQYEEGSQCVNCHAAEGAGGQAPYTLLDGEGEFVAQVNWLAPALDTVLLRYSREELARIIDLGRPGTPMPAWGAEGGGPRSEQEIDNIVDYLDSLQKTPEEAQREAQVQLAIELDLLDPDDRGDSEAVEAAVSQIDYEDVGTGEALFNLGKSPTFAGGAYACARCHTAGWSIITEGEDAVQPSDADLSDYVDYAQGAGAFAPPLLDLVPRQFATVDQLAEFVTLGTEDGVLYGRSGQGDGMMPGFGDDPNTDAPDDGMLTRDMVCAIARYEAEVLRDDVAAADGGEAGDAEGTTTTSTTSTTSTTTTTESDEDEGGEEDEGGGEAAAEEAPFCGGGQDQEGEG
jgi:cytochrome c553